MLSDDLKKSLQCISNNIIEEIKDYRDAQVSGKMLEYVKSLIDTYEDIEVYIQEKDKNYINKDENDVEGTMVDNRLKDALDEFTAYLGYKETYDKTHKQTDLDMSHQELNHFLQAIVDIFDEIEEKSRDNMEERSMIKMKIKQIYQSFN